MTTLKSGYLLAALSLAVATPLSAAPTIAHSDLTCSGVSKARDAEAAKFDHNLKVVFAREDGAYLGGARTEIARDGEFIALIRCPGPWVLADLPPGDYDLTSRLDGVEKTAEVTVEDDGVTQRVFTY